MFDESPVSKKLYKYFERKFVPSIAPIALLKDCAVVSCKLDRPLLSVLHVGPSRSLKTYTSNEALEISDREFWINLGSDFTMNSLKRYKADLTHGKCLFINDGTTLMASKTQRAKIRLIGGLSELLSDGTYTYQDFRQKWTISGSATSIMNITSESYLNYKDRLFGSTFSERFLTVHNVLTYKENEVWTKKEEQSKHIRFKDMITLDDIKTDVKITEKYIDRIIDISQRFSYLSLRTFVGCQDIIKGTLRAHASLNNRSSICEDDFEFVLMLEKYFLNPFSPNEGKIVLYASKGYTPVKICRLLGKEKSYSSYVRRIIETATIRGILDLEQIQIISKNKLRRDV